MTKNLFPALSAVLKSNKISLEKEEFKTVLDIINGKQVHLLSISPIANLIVQVFDQPELKDDEFYLVSANDAFAIAKNRSQLLTIFMKNSFGITKKTEVRSFTEVY